MVKFNHCHAEYYTPLHFPMLTCSIPEVGMYMYFHLEWEKSVNPAQMASPEMYIFRFIVLPITNPILLSWAMGPIHNTRYMSKYS